MACVWAARAPASPHVHRVLPDNCVDILWQDGGQPGFAVGMMSKAILVASERAVRTLAVRFKPGMAGPFLATPLNVLTDQRADIDLLWGRSDADRLTDALWTSEAPERTLLALIEQELLQRLRTAATAGTPLVQRALQALDGSAGVLRVEDLAQQLRVSRQHLAAQFRAHVGLSPKLYARICRFRRATAPLQHEPDWSGLAAECGYFDQSHLIHDFQELAGSTPERFHFSNRPAR
ncbi:helix-turn-helix transcriptional regulator [Duganella sp. BuS-21]